MDARRTESMATGGGMDYDTFELLNGFVLVVSDSEFSLYPSVKTFNHAFGYTDLGVYDPDGGSESLYEPLPDMFCVSEFLTENGVLKIQTRDGGKIEADDNEVRLINAKGKLLSSIPYDAENKLLDDYFSQNVAGLLIQDEVRLKEAMKSIEISIKGLFAPRCFPSEDAEQAIKEIMETIENKYRAFKPFN